MLPFTTIIIWILLSYCLQLNFLQEKLGVKLFLSVSNKANLHVLLCFEIDILSKDRFVRLNNIINDARTISIRFQKSEIRELWASEIRKLIEENNVEHQAEISQKVGRFWKRGVDFKRNKN